MRRLLILIWLVTEVTLSDQEAGSEGLALQMEDSANFNFFDLDYTYKVMGILGDIHLYTFKVSFNL